MKLYQGEVLQFLLLILNMLTDLDDCLHQKKPGTLHTYFCIAFKNTISLLPKTSMKLS